MKKMRDKEFKMTLKIKYWLEINRMMYFQINQEK